MSPDLRVTLPNARDMGTRAMGDTHLQQMIHLLSPFEASPPST
jgi:hypothetical protein